jgi:hypothetical protein
MKKKEKKEMIKTLILKKIKINIYMAKILKKMTDEEKSKLKYYPKSKKSYQIRKWQKT